MGPGLSIPRARGGSPRSSGLSRPGDSRCTGPPRPERTRGSISLVHDPAYVDRFREAASLGPDEADRPFTLFDSPDNPMSRSTFDVAERTVGLLLAAVDDVMAGSARRGFVVTRPPGHHARAAQAMGFCFFNAVAVAARDAQRRHGAGRVLVADFDVHHGNGTQETFWEDGSVAYLSVHRYPFYPGTGGLRRDGVRTGARPDGERPARRRGGRRDLRRGIRVGPGRPPPPLPARPRPRERRFRRSPPRSAGRNGPVGEGLWPDDAGARRGGGRLRLRTPRLGSRGGVRPGRERPKGRSPTPGPSPKPANPRIDRALGRS